MRFTYYEQYLQHFRRDIQYIVMIRIPFSYAAVTDTQERHDAMQQAHQHSFLSCEDVNKLMQTMNHTCSPNLTHRRVNRYKTIFFPN
jgi:hypothetical protein